MEFQTLHGRRRSSGVLCSSRDEERAYTATDSASSTEAGTAHQGGAGALAAALEAECGGGIVSCRFTHVYPDGPAPYYTFVGAARVGDERRQWEVLKAAASEALSASGGTITHHHAVGRLHRPWYDRERPALFADALAGVKRSLDPAGIMNPGVLV